MDEPPSTPSGDSTIPRRTFLAACATGCTALAGCVGAGGDGCGFGFELTMTPATDDDYLRETLTAPSRDRPGDWREIVSTAVEADEARYTTVHAPPVRDGDRIEFEGRYYRLSREAVAGEPVEAHVLAAEYDSGREPPSGATVVPFEDLPEADRAALREVFSDFEGRSDDVGGFSIGGYHVIYPDDTEADSVLVGEEPTWVRYEGATVEVRVEGTETVERVTYQFSAEELAEDREAYLEYARTAFVVELGDVPEDEREVFSRALEAGEDGVQLCEPEGPERAVVDRLEGMPASDTPRYGTWFVRYDGEVYLTELLEFAA